jgi:hypothetical protein
MGYSADERLLIVNCDDLGSSRSANSAIERALRAEVASSASLMVPCPWARAAARACRDLDIGIHLTLTSEYAAYRWQSLTGASSLHDRDGYLPVTAHEVWARADLGDVERECRAQIETALAWNVDVTHIDSHMEILQLDRQFFNLYVRLAESYRLPLRLSRRSWPFSHIARNTLAQAGVVTADNFYAPAWGETARPGLFARVGRLPRGATEVALHPVEDGEELRAYDTEFADIRVSDAECLMDTAWKHLLNSSGVRLIGFVPLREAMRRTRVNRVN